MNIFRRKKTQNEITQQEEPVLFDLPDFAQLVEKYDAVIHIGTPGTGSEAIQNFLFNNCSRLADLGFYYPVESHNNNNTSYGHSKLGRYLEENDLANAKSIFDEYLAEAKQNNLTLLLSEKALYAHPNRLKEVTLEKKCKIIALFREPIESLFSVYNQSVKNDFSTINFKTFCSNVLNSDDNKLSGKIFSQWRDCYLRQNLLVLGYDLNLFKQIRIEMLFLAALGIDNNIFDSFQYRQDKINQSHDFLALELRRWLNFVLDKELFYYNQRIDWLLQNYLEQPNDKPEFFIQEHISQELYLSLKHKFKETNNALLTETLTSIEPGFLAEDKTADNPLTIESIKYNDSQLKNILEIIIEKDATTKQYLINKTTKALSTKSVSYYVLRLADILGSDITPYVDTLSPITTNVNTPPLFTKAQINVFLSERVQNVHFLTQIAITMERHGDYQAALLIIDKALELRPNGPSIMAWRNRIMSKI